MKKLFIFIIAAVFAMSCKDNTQEPQSVEEVSIVEEAKATESVIEPTTVVEEVVEECIEESVEEVTFDYIEDTSILTDGQYLIYHNEKDFFEDGFRWPKEIQEMVGDERTILKAKSDWLSSNDRSRYNDYLRSFTMRDKELKEAQKALTRKKLSDEMDKLQRELNAINQELISKGIVTSLDDPSKFANMVSYLRDKDSSFKRKYPNLATEQPELHKQWYTASDKYIQTYRKWEMNKPSIFRSGIFRRDKQNTSKAFSTGLSRND